MPALFVLILLSIASAVAPREPRSLRAPGMAVAPVVLVADRTTADGVYTAAQAEAGEALFVEVCQACHVPDWHRSIGFYGKWHGKPLSQLVSYVRLQMPQTDPGSLTAEEYGQVSAYLLRLTGMPAGAEMLNPDPAVLGEIRIDTIPSRTR